MSGDPRDLAEQANEAVRALNHATLDPSAVLPVDVYHVLGSLASMMHRTEQALGQIHRAAAQWEATPGREMRADSGDLAGVLAALDAKVSAAVGQVWSAAMLLDSAQQAASQLSFSETWPASSWSDQ